MCGFSPLFIVKVESFTLLMLFEDCISVVSSCSALKKTLESDFLLWRSVVSLHAPSTQLEPSSCAIQLFQMASCLNRRRDAWLRRRRLPLRTVTLPTDPYAPYPAYSSHKIQLLQPNLFILPTSSSVALVDASSSDHQAGVVTRWNLDARLRWSNALDTETLLTLQVQGFSLQAATEICVRLTHTKQSHLIIRFGKPHSYLDHSKWRIYKTQTVQIGG